MHKWVRLFNTSSEVKNLVKKRLGGLIRFQLTKIRMMARLVIQQTQVLQSVLLRNRVLQSWCL